MKQEIDSLNAEWHDVLKQEFEKQYFIQLINFIEEERKKKTIFPKEDNVFNAFNLTPLSKVKIVILGQDPYHGTNQAHGLAFSVNEANSIPPSLKNIFKELNTDLNCHIPHNGNLTKWSEEGVLLLNTILTVRSGEPHSHKSKGWEIFTDKIIEIINERYQNIVFILLGSPAQLKEKMLNKDKHLIIKAPHPSPLSSYRGFFGSKIFSRTNDYLKLNNIKEVNWCLENND
ncbi:MAG: uracil-DNA glycosylase [Sulfurimonas sp.]|jgi:uracil-DNA glycosylase